MSGLGWTYSLKWYGVKVERSLTEQIWPKHQYSLALSKNHYIFAFFTLITIDSNSLVSQCHALSKIQQEMNTDKIKQPDIADSLSMQTSANRDAPSPPGR